MNLEFYKRLSAFRGGFDAYFLASEENKILASAKWIEKLAPHFNAKDFDQLLRMNPVIRSDNGTPYLLNEEVVLTEALLEHASKIGDLDLLEKMISRETRLQILHAKPHLSDDAIKDALHKNHVEFALKLQNAMPAPTELDLNFLCDHRNPSLKTVHYLHETRELPLELALQEVNAPQKAPTISSVMNTAASQDNLEVFKYCVEHGCNPYRVSDHQSVFDRACMQGSESIVQHMVESVMVNREAMVRGALISILGGHEKNFDYLASRPEISATFQRGIATELDKLLAQDGTTIEALRDDITRNGLLEMIPLLKKTELYESLVSEDIRRDEASLPKYEFWRKHGKGNRAWLALTGQDAPNYELREISPYGFKRKVYEELAAVLSFAASDEGNTYSDYKTEAAKLAMFFGSVEAAERHLKKFVDMHPDSHQPVHDACLFKLPTKGDWAVSAWRDLTLKHGMEATKLLSIAPQIERELGHPPKSLKELKPFKDTPLYAEREQNMAFAKLCHAQGISEEGFNRGLIVLAKIKTSDHIPDIGVIDGKHFNNQVTDHSGYYMAKLPAEDPRALVLGMMVGCCNHIDGATATMACAAMTSPDCGNYAIFQKSSKTAEPQPVTDAIVGKITVWKSEAGNLVFNSWERKSGYSMHGEQFINAAAEKILRDNADIERVVLGRNRDKFARFTLLGEDSDDYVAACKRQNIDPPQLEKPRDPSNRSADSLEQYLVLDQAGLKARDKIKKLEGSGKSSGDIQTLAAQITRKTGPWTDTVLPRPSGNIYRS